MVLLDEFEKAHPSIFDVLLQVLGEGRVTDAGGRTADFRSAIVIMTSNLGAAPREQRKPGLRRAETEAGAREALATHFREKVEGFFRPEFVNRLDRIVVFQSLGQEAMRGIARRELDRLLQREGFEAIYRGGYAAAAAAHGLPDLGVTTLTENADHLCRSAAAVDVIRSTSITTAMAARCEDNSAGRRRWIRISGARA